MCASCGCDAPNERHQKGDITLDDIRAAGENHGLNMEQAAENIRKAVIREEQPTQA